MKNKKSNVGSYVAVVVILLCALAFIFYMLEESKKSMNAKPITSQTTTTTTSTNTTKVIDIKNNNSSQDGEESEQFVTMVNNFSVALSSIIRGLNINEDYKIEKEYEGAEFNFNCNNYDEKTYKCTSGGAMMKVDNALIPLFTYDNEEENYFNDADNYFISILDERIIISFNHVGKSAGTLKMFDRNGEVLSTYNGVLNGFVMNGQLRNKLFPVVDNNVLSFNVCEDNQVVAKNVDLSVPASVVSKGRQLNSTCY